jgi:hypothetical protein
MAFRHSSNPVYSWNYLSVFHHLRWQLDAVSYSDSSILVALGGHISVSPFEETSHGNKACESPPSLLASMGACDGDSGCRYGAIRFFTLDSDWSNKYPTFRVCKGFRNSSYGFLPVRTYKKRIKPSSPLSNRNDANVRIAHIGSA